MTVFELKKELRSEFAHEGDAVLSHALKKDSAYILAHANSPVTEAEAASARECAQRLRSGEPLQYVLGVCDFFGLEFTVTPQVLIPRFDTETIVSCAVGVLPRGAFFADICCGSGCIGISVLKHRPDTTAVLCDISEQALDVCLQNARRHGVLSRCEALYLDVTRPEQWEAVRGLDCLISNPPYIPSGDIAALHEQVLREPRIALDGGRDGGDYYRAILDNSYASFRLRRHIIFEIGCDGGELIKSLAEANGCGCEITKDLSGRDRCAELRDLQ